MARPKKAPRDRIQITLTKKTARDLRKFAKSLDRDISEIVEASVRHVMDKYVALNDKSIISPFPAMMKVEFPK